VGGSTLGLKKNPADFNENGKTTGKVPERCVQGDQRAKQTGDKHPGELPSFRWQVGKKGFLAGRGGTKVGRHSGGKQSNRKNQSPEAGRNAPEGRQIGQQKDGIRVLKGNVSGNNYASLLGRGRTRERKRKETEVTLQSLLIQEDRKRKIPLEDKTTERLKSVHAPFEGGWEIQKPGEHVIEPSQALTPIRKRRWGK